MNYYVDFIDIVINNKNNKDIIKQQQKIKNRLDHISVSISKHLEDPVQFNMFSYALKKKLKQNLVKALKSIKDYTHFEIDNINTKLPKEKQKKKLSITPLKLPKEISISLYQKQKLNTTTYSKKVVNDMQTFQALVSETPQVTNIKHSGIYETKKNISRCSISIPFSKIKLKKLTVVKKLLF
ncbi:uncharacterized protein LOC126899398 [Daktulosphaira vitifoliae]|uniref:uncharacterized protein LOC126899398 n=1 Tax=Daktulosphaira vitifoliae TaxID=58002 RepID=UPI0021AAD98B|nr:uncharacterized protein LOC126899398 [Daktulosphaira vitifoliae]